MRNIAIAAAVFIGVALAGGAIAKPSSGTGEAALEHRLDAQIVPDELRDWMKQLAAEPNHVGSPHDKQNAEQILAWFKSWGWEARIETFWVLYPTPLHESLELVAPRPYTATLQEPPIPGDTSATATQPALPAYLAYQGDGDVIAPLVYVNYGMPKDYAQLQRMGISVKGKIAIARYGEGWRGLKPKLAQDHGALGCIIYSDPAQDGYADDRTYPQGPMRPARGIQRGSVSDMALYPGDPLTPGIGATRNAKRLKISQAATVLKIPALPISYADARVLLAELDGPPAPADWRGALGITYHVGPGPAKVHLVVKSDWSIKPIYDVIATIPGVSYPNQWVIRGNHHDGWVFGASDPISGQVALLAEAKAIGALVKQGWHPRRTIVYASWDGEEPMLLGSTEWGETRADELRRKAVLYINSDTNGRGFLRAEGSQDFARLVNQVAADVNDPETGVSIGQRLRAKLMVEAADPSHIPPAFREEVVQAAKIVADPSRDFPLAALGSGSDYSVFIDHLGVPALDISFGQEGITRGVYHSRYDTFEHHSRFVDPGFVYDALLAKTIGRLVLRSAQSPAPEQSPGDFAEMVADYLDQVKSLAQSERAQAETRDRLLRIRAFTLAADPTKTNVPPPALSRVPYIEFAPLENAVAHLKRSAKAYDDASAKHSADVSADRLARVQALMLTLDQTLTPANVGLPGRRWYLNLVYAPGRYTGYGAKTLPGVREAIEERRWEDADRYVKFTADAIEAYSERLDEATKVLGGG
jgi:N-acetylated-alpha-linked acidic dipeptidase